MKIRQALFLCTAVLVSAAAGAGTAVLFLDNAVSAQQTATAYEPLPPELRSGIIRPVELIDQVQTQYAIQGHYGEWIQLYRAGATTTSVWMNLSTHRAWEPAPPGAAAPTAAEPTVLPPVSPARP